MWWGGEFFVGAANVLCKLFIRHICNAIKQIQILLAYDLHIHYVASMPKYLWTLHWTLKWNCIREKSRCPPLQVYSMFESVSGTQNRTEQKVNFHINTLFTNICDRVIIGSWHNVYVIVSNALLSIVESKIVFEWLNMEHQRFVWPFLLYCSYIDSLS